MLMKRTFFTLAIALAMAGCYHPDKSALRVNIGTEVQGLDQHIVTGVPEHRVLSTLFEGLADADPDTLEPIPGAAQSWDISPDGMKYVFHLRPEGKWSNGDPVTAGDFVYSARRILTPALAAEYAYMFHCVKNARAFNEGKITDFSQVGVKAVDELTLEITLENPTPYLLGMQIHDSWYPVHPPTIENFGRIDERNTKWTRPGNLVGNGAFTLKRWVPNNIIEVVRNEHYWNRDKVRLERILFYPIENQLTEERSFRTGLIDLTESALTTKVPSYRRNRPNLIKLDPYLATYFYRFNTVRPPFNDPRVRRAFAMTVDRVAICTRIMTANQRPAYAFTVPDPHGYTCTEAIPFDPEAARRLLAEAGYPGGKGFPDVSILYNTQVDHKTIAEAIQSMWKEHLGVNVALLNQEWKVYMDSERNFDYDISRAGWVGDFNDPINFLEIWTKDNGNNRTGWYSDEYERLLEQSRRTADQEQRYEVFQKAEKILLDEAPLLPIYYYTHVYFKSARVKNWHSNLLSYFSFKDVYLEEEAN